MYKTRLIPERVCICDRCGRVMSSRNDDEDQERLAIDFTAGYASVFGDGNRVQADLCQHCVQKVLGRWLRISEPPEYPPRQPRQPEQPLRAWQPYQLRERKEREALFATISDRFRRNAGIERRALQTPQNEVHHD